MSSVRGMLGMRGLFQSITTFFLFPALRVRTSPASPASPAVETPASIFEGRECSR